MFQGTDKHLVLLYQVVFCMILEYNCVHFDHQSICHHLEIHSSEKVKKQESWCEVKKCDKINQNIIDNCLICEEFSNCPNTDYQRNRYSYLFKHIDFIKKKGFEKFLEEEEKKGKEGVEYRKSEIIRFLSNFL